MPQPGPRATLVFMHHLGGSAETWRPVEDRLAPNYACVRLDLPGFGASAGDPGRSVAGMADSIEQALAERVDGPFVLVGHSMSAKVALLIARRRAESDRTAAHLAGLVLAAGSPPAPEPMEEEKRTEMLGWFAGDARQSRREADGFVKANVAAALDNALHEAAVHDVLRASKPAWRHWLQHGSLEDLHDEIDRLSLAALVLAGADDEALGEAIQRELMMPHLPQARLEVVAGAAHLLPMEQPDRVATLIAAFVDELHGGAASNRMTRRTLALLQARGQSGESEQVLNSVEMATLRALVDRILPMPEEVTIDLAAKLDEKLADGTGDGWRFAILPPDTQAYRLALATFDLAAREISAGEFVAIAPAQQDALIEKTAAGELDIAGAPLSAEAMQNWLLDLRGDCCQLFLTHPAIQARTNILAAATGGDAMLRGFEQIGANESEPWEQTMWQEHA